MIIVQSQRSKISQILYTNFHYENTSQLLSSAFSNEMPQWAIQISRGKVCPCHVCMCVCMVMSCRFTTLILTSFILLFSGKTETQQPTKTYLVRTTILHIWNFLHLLKNILYPFFTLSYCLSQCPVLYSGGPCDSAQVSHPWRSQTQ